MGKASRWFRSLFSGSKKSSSDLPASSGSSSRPSKDKRRGLDSKNYATNRGSFTGSSSPYMDSHDPNKHAMAVAVATAAVAEAALAAAHAAAEVVRLTNGGSRASTAAYYSGSNDRRRELAAVKIQSTFRAYLARRALRALKGLVKLQALVRGHIVRKQSADMLRRMQAMARVQARASINRTCISESSHSSSRSSHSHHHGLSIPVNYDQHRAHTNFDGSLMKRSSSKPNTRGTFGPDKPQLHSNWLDHWMEENSWNSQRGTSVKYARADDERNDKILEVDTWKPHLNPNPRVRTNQKLQQRNTLPSDSLSRLPTKPQKKNQGLFSLGSMKQEEADQVLRTAESSPRVCSVSSRPGSSYKPSPFTPARSECSRSFFGDYLSYPSYMANTESYQAKLRSQSAPRQRLQFEKPGPTQRLWDVDTNSERGLGSPAKLRTRGYPGGSQFASGYNSIYGGRS